MKKIGKTFLIYSVGIMMANAAIAATATKDQWNNSVDGYPERRTDMKIEEIITTATKDQWNNSVDGYPERRTDMMIEEITTPPGSSCVKGDQPGIERIPDTKVLRLSGKDAFICGDVPRDEYANLLYGDVTACTGDDTVAIAGTATTEAYNLMAKEYFKKTNYVWRCGAERLRSNRHGALLGIDEWFPSWEMDDCTDDVYQNFKYKDNVQAYIFDSTVSTTEIYEMIVNPSNYACITYACAPDYKPTFDITDTRKINDSVLSQLQCIKYEKSCPLYNSSHDVSDRGYPNELKTEKCNNASYWFPSTNMSLPTRGTIYIDMLKDRMNNQLKNSDQVKRLYALNPKNGVFTCNDLECELTGDVLQADKTNCDYLCTDNGFAVRLTNDRDDNPCPTYFKYEYDETEKMYVCNFDAEAVNDKIKQMNAGCAKLFCEKSGGVYNNDNGNCTCEGRPCNDNYSYGGHDFKYCYKRSMGEETRCEKDPNSNENWWSTSNMNDLEKDRGTWISALETCMSDAPASSGASSINAATDSISKLAGRLAKVEDQFGLSKWRTAEGKFNTARLASDLTAGVVLGTTGALVTSSVVKKKQVKDGFESLECTVGGQHVGDWGDVFRIDGK